MDRLAELISSRFPWRFDQQNIYDEWKALKGAYDVNCWALPLPLWAQRGYDHSGLSAWEILQQELWSGDENRPMSVYIHVPFCSSKCGFCDSYSFALSAANIEEKEAYVDLLCSELDLWSRTGIVARRPVSTVHLGGGTPTFLGEKLFTRLVYHLLDNLNVNSETEWALESNITTLTPIMVDTLSELGFRRIHIGVQSLEDPVRKAIGRRQPASRAIAVISQLIQCGWIVSVDLICGLPGQTLAGVVEGIEALVDIGVNGYSLYELLIYPQNEKWAERHGLGQRDHLANYCMFQAGASTLEARGFRKNLFNHWADQVDRNIYFTFPLRGEDLLAMGCIADGVFGDYHYRHLSYPDYLLRCGEDFPGLLGGLRRSEIEKRVYSLVIAIQSGYITTAQAAEINGFSSKGGFPLFDHWLDHALIAPSLHDGYQLTTSGSWFAGNMISEINAGIARIVSD